MRRPRAKLTEEESLNGLAEIARFTHHEVVDALRAKFITFVADAFFRANQTHVPINPASTIAYQALDALEERAIVRVAESLEKLPKTFATSIDIRGKGDLIKHRHAVSHPLTIRWDSQDMQAFADAHRQWLDFRAGILWDMDRFVLDKLVAHGRPVPNGDLSVTPEMGKLLHHILSSCNPSAPVPDAPALVIYMTNNTSIYRQLLEKHADGQTGKRKTGGTRQAPPE